MVLAQLEALSANDQNTHCECAEDGYCKRYKRIQAGRLRQICRGENIDPGEAAKYRALWAAEADGKPAGWSHNVECPHRTAEPLQENGQAKLRQCGTCTNRVQLKLFGCDHPSLALANRLHETTQQDCNTCEHRPRNLIGARALILRNRLCPGDVLVMSAAIYSLHRAHPGRFATAVETTAMQLWEHNPDVLAVDAIREMNPTSLEMHYPAVNQSNQRAIHFMAGYCEYLSDVLGVPVPLSTNRPLLYLSRQEKAWMNQVQEITRVRTKFWLVNNGWKNDYPAKWWPWYQEVVDRLRGKITFVQVGETDHNHPPLRGVINLVGKTDTRQLCRLCWHAEGVLCGVTFLMHVAAALQKPAVILAGGREPRCWNTYPHQTLLSTVGMLECCRDGGCWKSRTVARNDGSDLDRSICAQPVPVGDGFAPRCLAMLGPDEVVRALESYYAGGVLRY